MMSACLAAFVSAISKGSLINSDKGAYKCTPSSFSDYEKDFYKRPSTFSPTEEPALQKGIWDWTFTKLTTITA